MELEAHLLNVTEEMEAEMRRKETRLALAFTETKRWRAMYNYVNDQRLQCCPLLKPDEENAADEANAPALVEDPAVLLAEDALDALDEVLQKSTGADCISRGTDGDVDLVVARAEEALKALDNMLLHNRTRNHGAKCQTDFHACHTCSGTCEKFQDEIEAGNRSITLIEA